MTGTINNTKYAEILATALPRKIETEEENERVSDKQLSRHFEFLC